ncbi:uncharacterized protein BDZ99DRAFT_542030 [Mytilinidion resinicola]|uniref:Uncharacterized protein n=1 Tax=Mytilinidion resinicola TaxID=574789 RepID=A0A6A6Z4A2_9PEZI|nr:uncharacterized protein BDZ99DRAFT_542030 [Mytilinidion resinicola]KAF2815971.1 hypothetical protein BDZ99DRAFT_542030 [Mytilinidion resinicola]
MVSSASRSGSRCGHFGGGDDRRRGFADGLKPLSSASVLDSESGSSGSGERRIPVPSFFAPFPSFFFFIGLNFPKAPQSTARHPACSSSIGAGVPAAGRGRRGLSSTASPSISTTVMRTPSGSAAADDCCDTRALLVLLLVAICSTASSYLESGVEEAEAGTMGRSAKRTLWGEEVEDMAGPAVENACRPIGMKWNG